MTTLFDELFPRLYGQSPRGVQDASVGVDADGVGSVRNLTQVDMQCLRHAHAELRPFGEIPRRLAATLARSLDAARTLLNSITLGVQVFPFFI